MRQAYGIDGRGLDTMGPASLEGCDREVGGHQAGITVKPMTCLDQVCSMRLLQWGMSEDLRVVWDLVARGDGALAWIKHEVNCR